MPDKLNLIRINDVVEPNLPILLRLYEETFPIEERRRPEELLSLLNKENMYLLEISEAGQPLGFIISWNLPYCRFVEHLAIFPEYRGRDVGSRALQWLMEQDRPLLLEVEQPADYLSHRRIAFYLQNGLHRLNVPYFQPPYHKGQAPIPMLLMSDKPHWKDAELRTAVSTIHQQVYGIGE